MPSFQYYNRYTGFLVEGKQTTVPFVDIPAKTSDKKFVYKVGVSRLDKVSQQYYRTPYFGWLILMANPLLGSIEFEIPDKAYLRIPFPLTDSLQDYKTGVDLYHLYYGE